MTEADKFKLVERIVNSGEKSLVDLHCNKTSSGSGRIIITGMPASTPFDTKLYYGSCDDFCFGDSRMPSSIGRISFLDLVDRLGKGSNLKTYKNLARAYSKAITVLKGVSSWEELELRLDIADL